MVWGGAAWWLFIRATRAWGIFMLAWGLVSRHASDNLIRPWLISRGVEMPLTLVILGVFGGFLSFGFLGLFVGPALLAIAFTLSQPGAPPCAAGPRDDQTRSSPWLATRTLQRLGGRFAEGFAVVMRELAQVPEAMPKGNRLDQRRRPVA